MRLQRKVGSKHSGNQSGLPGWGNVNNPDDWAAVDKQNAIDFGTEGMFDTATAMKK